MIIFPAIDLMDGRAVRLLQGRKADATDYGDPADVARKWQEQGANVLHMVDLDGAFDGQSQNGAAVRRIVKETGLTVQLGGGIRTLEDIALRIEDYGVARCILGTVAIENPELVREACKRYPGRIACGIDARGGRVAVRGWVDQSELTALELALSMRDMGVDTIIYTDIARDGMLTGPNVPETAALVKATGMRIIGSGGVSGMDDLEALSEAGCYGAIVGKALYTGAIALGEAINTFEKNA